MRQVRCGDMPSSHLAKLDTKMQALADFPAVVQAQIQNLTPEELEIFEPIWPELEE